MIRARNSDPQACSDDFIAFSNPVDLPTAFQLVKEGNFSGIIAPGFHQEALALLLKRKQDSSWIIIKADNTFVPPEIEFREIFGVALKYHRRNNVSFSFHHIVTKNKVIPDDVMQDAIIACCTVNHTLQNAIVFAKQGQTVAIVSGEQNRMLALQFALQKLANWWFRQHPKVRALKFQTGMPSSLCKTLTMQYVEDRIERTSATEGYFCGQLPEPLARRWKVR